VGGVYNISKLRNFEQKSAVFEGFIMHAMPGILFC